ncbi:MAG: hypothetical protein A3J24_11375 [Deltaproteobacteria bacterium RIFCSPLOWO2_02_FULL_53_8]|nr:MAG: hypothetical protein A3J24_11375 [Deltaproteobacteria bacterium RIFCSPLOWO2_02_FULL_53_8]
MIDPTDKQTAALPLEQPKRGRGRPSTGAAMTPAEKQRAYRQRLAEQKNNQVPEAKFGKVRSTAAERIEQLEQQLADAITRAELAEARADVMGNELAIIKAKLGKASATIVNIKTSNVTENKTLWDVESQVPGKHTWQKVAGYPWPNQEAAEEFARKMPNETHLRYRVVQVKAPK